MKILGVELDNTYWHLTSHLIAIAALIVACFAITGYISFRDTSIPDSALEDDDSDIVSKIVDIPLGALDTKFVIPQPANTYINDVSVLVTDKIVGTNDFQIQVGTTSGAADIRASMRVFIAGTYDIGALGFPTFPSNKSSTSIDRDVHYQFTTATITTAGTIKVFVKYNKL